jgi:hypothetical protein
VIPDHDEDSALPEALIRAQDDLAAYIRDRVSPDAILLKIMEAADGLAPEVAPPAAPRSNGNEQAHHAIRLRARARDLQSSLDRARSVARGAGRDVGLETALDLSRDLTHAVARDRWRDRARRDRTTVIVAALMSELARVISGDQARGPALDLAAAPGRDLDLDFAAASGRVLDPGLAADLVRRAIRDLDLPFDFDRDLIRAREHAGRRVDHLKNAIETAGGIDQATLQFDRIHATELTAAIAEDLEDAHVCAHRQAEAISAAVASCLQALGEAAAAPVDVSGTDLSGEDIGGNLDVLQNIIWTPETTTWPVGVAEQLLPRSREIRDGVYQVVGEGEHEPREPVKVS